MARRSSHADPASPKLTNISRDSGLTAPILSWSVPCLLPSHSFPQWTRWNGTTLAPDLTPAGLVGVELYSHHDVGLSYSFDTFENENEAASNPTVVTVLRAVLHEALANQTRIASLPPIR
jgi:hypothetical protein